MTISIDPEQAFWWAALAGVLVALWCLLADTAVKVVRTAVEMSRPNRPKQTATADHTRAS